jgi:hypothetical protein
LIEALCLLAVPLLWWKGFAQQRPASDVSRRAESVVVSWTGWTIASSLPLVALALWLLAPLRPFAPQGRGGAFWIPALCGGFLLGSAAAVVRAALVRVVLANGQLCRAAPWGVLDAWSAGSLCTVSFWEGRGIAAAELRFAAGQRLTLYPAQQNADELLRRLLLGAPDAVLATLDETLREEILATRKAPGSGRGSGPP